MALLDLLNKARRRIIFQLALDKGALALTAGMAGVILLLLTGTDILDWYWPVLLAVASLGWGIYQLRRHIPSLYELAQSVDRRLGLADHLSTAVHFLAHPARGAEEVCDLQRRAAEHTAAQVNLQQAVPYTRSRYLLPAAGLLLVALGLFAVRYAIVGSLDLRDSLVQVTVDNFFSTPEERAAALKARADMRAPALDLSDPTAEAATPETEVPADSKDGSELTQGSEDPNGKQSDKDGESSNQESDQNGDSQDNESGEDKSGKQGDKQGEPKDGQQSQPQDNQDQRSMMDKLRDAVNNLMNQMNTQPKQDAKSSSEKSQPNKDKSGDKGDDKSEKSEGEPQADSSKGDPKNAQPGKSSDAPGQKPGEGSGMGTNDGEKALQEAQMLEAMGKVSELLGQRAELISGEMMVEVGATKQQLRTAYTDQQGTHAEAGGEIHRDEVPLMYQQYVERYFTEIRKGESQGKAAKSAAQASKSGPSEAKPAQ